MLRVKVSGIYKISISDYYYIGMSVDVFGRWQSHLTDLYLKRHSSKKLQSIFDDNSITDFRFEVLEHISKTKTKQECKLKGKAFDSHFRTLLLQKEKEHMRTYSVSYALNQDNKHFYISL